MLSTLLFLLRTFYLLQKSCAMRRRFWNTFGLHNLFMQHLLGLLGFTMNQECTQSTANYCSSCILQNTQNGVESGHSGKPTTLLLFPPISVHEIPGFPDIQFESNSCWRCLHNSYTGKTEYYAPAHPISTVDTVLLIASSFIRFLADEALNLCSWQEMSKAESIGLMWGRGRLCPQYICHNTELLCQPDFRIIQDLVEGGGLRKCILPKYITWNVTKSSIWIINFAQILFLNHPN